MSAIPPGFDRDRVALTFVRVPGGFWALRTLYLFVGRIIAKGWEQIDPRDRWGAVVALAATQHGVISCEQLRGFGFSPSTIGRYAAQDRLHRIHLNVYALVPDALLTPLGRRMAAVLACGTGASLSLHSAGRHRGLMDSSRTYIDVTVPTRGGRAREGIRIHRSKTLRPLDVELVQGIPCTTVARTIFDLAEVLTPRRLERLLDEAEFQGVLDLTALDEQIEHNRGRPRPAARLRNALAVHRPGSTLTDGPLGEEMLAIIRRIGLPEPRVQHWIDLDDGEPMIQADFAWPEAKVILETDGNQAHGKPLRTQADYRRDQRAGRAGWHTVRATAAQIRGEPRRLGETLAAVVRGRWPKRAA